MDYEDIDVMTKCKHGYDMDFYCADCDQENTLAKIAEDNAKISAREIQGIVYEDIQVGLDAERKQTRFKLAEKALIKMVSIRSPGGLDYPTETKIAKSAVRYADALLKELDK